MSLRYGRATHEYATREASADEAGPVLKRYVAIATKTQAQFKATQDSPVEDFVAEADRHPVFELVAVGSEAPGWAPAANSCHRSGTPRRVCSLDRRTAKPDPATRSLMVRDTRTSPGAAQLVACGDVQGDPCDVVADQSIARVQAGAGLAAQTVQVARGLGTTNSSRSVTSNTVSTPSPMDFTSRPACRSICRVIALWCTSSSIRRPPVTHLQPPGRLTRRGLCRALRRTHAPPGRRARGSSR